MQVLELDPTCPECSVRLIDNVDEFVCPCCGVTEEKEVLDAPVAARPRPQEAVRLPLGSYMGGRDPSHEERSSRGIAGSDSTYQYLKAVSDFAGRDEGSSVACARLIERVGEKLLLPRMVLLEAAATANRVLASVRSRRRVTLAAVSAFSLVSACRLAGVSSVGIREIMVAHVALGKRLSYSAIVELSLEYPVRTYAHGPEQYLARVLAHLSADAGLARGLEREGAHQAAYLNRLREASRELLGLVDRTEMLGKRPCALAASAVYSAEVVLSTLEGRKRRITQRAVAEGGGTSEYTVRDQCAAMFMPAVVSLVARRRRTLPPQPAG